jgi:hypothetical protein
MNTPNFTQVLKDIRAVDEDARIARRNKLAAEFRLRNEELLKAAGPLPEIDYDDLGRPLFPGASRRYCGD